MTTLVVTLHVIACIFLILVVLLQSGKGAGMGVAIGGGAGQALFGASGPATILTKITTAIAIIFMVTSLSLAYMSGNKGSDSVMKGSKAPVEAAADQTAN
ncbi:MAG: preprotein translocase subunit SecG [Desulfobacterales bacterium]|nr:preprotein translocase subunit SecG [Desulfobacterales bacterium]